MHHASNARTEFISGVRAFIPLIMANAPLGMVCGAAAVAADMTPWQAFSMSWIIFAGSSQIIATQLLSGGAPWLVIVATAAVVNLRFMMYSASFAPHAGALNKRWQAVLAYLITDQAFAIGITRYMLPGDTRQRHWFLLGISGATWVCWQIASAAGILLGRLIPQDWSIDFVLPLTFIAIVVPMLSERAMLCAAVVGGSASVLLILPLKLNLITATAFGIAAGLIAEKLRKNTQ